MIAMPSVSPGIRGRAALLLILAVYFPVVLYSSQKLSPADDEPTHLRNGMGMMTRWAYSDPQRAWWTTPDLATPILDILPALLARASGQSPDYRGNMFTGFRQLKVARAANHALGALLLVLVFVWAGRLWGPLGGAIATLFLAAHPLFLAHCTIISTDLYMALGCLAAAWTIWEQFIAAPEKMVEWGWPLARAGLWAGLAIVFATLCKLNNLLFIPVAGMAACWAAWRTRGRSPLAAWAGRGLAVSALAALFVLTLVAAAYEVTHINTPSFVVGGRTINLPFGQPLMLAIHLVGKLHLNQPLVFYSGWLLPPRPWFYVASFLLKTPLFLLPLLPLALLAALGDTRRRKDARIAFYLLALLAAMGCIFTTRHIFMGLRHMLPLIVLLALLVGALGRARDLLGPSSARPLLALVALCLAAGAAETLWATPWQLSYFNPLGRHRLVLVDSDSDWGQGLIALRDWQKRHAPRQPLWLAYFGNNDPADFGIRYRGLLSPFSAATPSPEGARLHTPAELAGRGFVAISRTHLAGTYMTYGGASSDYYALWRDLKPATILGGSINLYDMRKK